MIGFSSWKCQPHAVLMMICSSVIFELSLNAALVSMSRRKLASQSTIGHARLRVLSADNERGEVSFQ